MVMHPNFTATPYWTSLYLSVVIDVTYVQHSSSLHFEIYKKNSDKFSTVGFLSLFSALVSGWILWRICFRETKLQSHIEWCDIIISFLHSYTLTHASTPHSSMHASRNFWSKVFAQCSILVYSTTDTHTKPHLLQLAQVLYDVQELHIWINFSPKTL